jgi:hypothetical protein
LAKLPPWADSGTMELYEKKGKGATGKNPRLVTE